MVVSDAQYWEAACMTLLQALNRKCPDFEKVMEYLPDAFKDQKAARNRWEKLMRDIKNKDQSESPTKGTPTKMSSPKKPSKLSTSTRTPQKSKRAAERYDSDFSISVTPHLDTRSSTVKDDCTLTPFDDFNHDSPFTCNPGVISKPDTPSKRTKKRKLDKALCADNIEDFAWGPL